jgi:hypothetical protein
MQIVIDIPDKDYQVTLTKIMLACYGCKITELPKGHGALKDAGMIKRFLYSSAKFWGTWNLGKHRIFNAIDNVGAVIEADKEDDDADSD